MFHGYNAKLDLQVMHVTSTDKIGISRYVEIRISDSVSGLGVVDLRLTPEQFTAALSSTFVGRIDTAWLLPSEHRHKLGLAVQHRSIKLPDALDRVMPYGRTDYVTIGQLDESKVPETVRTWIIATIEDELDDDDEWRLTKHNSGWQLHMRRYVSPTPKLDPSVTTVDAVCDGES